VTSSGKVVTTTGFTVMMITGQRKTAGLARFDAGTK